MLVNFYEADLAGNVTAPSTPGDGVYTNALLGDGRDNDFVGESGATVNYMFGFAGEDWMYGGGDGSDNYYFGGDGVDTAFVVSSLGSSAISLGYYGGMTITKPDSGIDVVGADTEIADFTDVRIVSFNAGDADGMTTNTLVALEVGDVLALSMDWIYAYYDGLITVQLAEVNGNGSPDTVFTGAAGINTYALLDYDFQEHSIDVIGVYGEGALLDLDW
jgi:hypothetical protein